VIDPLYDDDELRALGFEPWDGREAAGAILQADHAGYTALGPSDLPGVRAVVDGAGCSTARASPRPAWRCGASAAADRQSAARAATTRAPACPSP
jgi:hypothetical protein